MSQNGHVDAVSVMLQGADKAALLEAAGRLASIMAEHIQSIGTKLDLGDKAFALAIDAGLLGELGGSAVLSVRKLWVDYALSDKGR